MVVGVKRWPMVRMSIPSTPDDLIEIPKRFVYPNVMTLLEFVFQGDYDGEDVGSRVVLCPTNAMVDEINEEVVRRIPDLRAGRALLGL